MRLLLSFLVVTTPLIAQEAGAPSSVEHPAGLVGEGHPWATPWYSVSGADAGPTVLITGGVHGNEPAGAEAAQQIRFWPVKRGRLVVVPRVNRLGLTARTRWFPPNRNDRKLRDLNRNFPTEEKAAPRGPIAESLWELVKTVEPDFVIDLHEGFDFHVRNNKSVGSSVICAPTERASQLAKLMQARVNAGISDKRKRFDLLNKSGPVEGSMVRACAGRLGADAFILETTFKDQPVSLRTRQHRVMVSALLNELGLVDLDCSSIVGRRDEGKFLRLGLFDGPGTTEGGRRNVGETFNLPSNFTLSHFGPVDVTPDFLSQFDVLVLPGGSGGKQGRSLGREKRDAIRNFAQSGGGIVGICAGAYLCSSHYPWSLHVINTGVYNTMEEIPGVGKKSMWFRGGPEDVSVQFTVDGTELLTPEATAKVRYQNGPIISPGPETDLPKYKVLAWFRSEVAKYEPQKGTMVDTPAIVSASFGTGRIMSISPHPEATVSLRHALVNAVRWAAGRQRE